MNKKALSTELIIGAIIALLVLITILAMSGVFGDGLNGIIPTL